MRLLRLLIVVSMTRVCSFPLCLRRPKFQKLILLEYKLMNITTEVGYNIRGTDNNTYFVVTLHLQRLYGYHIMNSFFPSLLMGLVSYSTFYFQVNVMHCMYFEMSVILSIEWHVLSIEWNALHVLSIECKRFFIRDKKKIRFPKNNFRFFSYFPDFWDFFVAIFSFKGVWWPSQCDLDHFKS